jgi:hypothetical protein
MYEQGEWRTGMSETREDWPFGAELRRRRTLAGLSVKAAARRTNGEVSDGRWYQLESGVQKIRGQEIPIGTTPATVAAAAKAVDWDITDALTVAGFDPRDYAQTTTTERPVLMSQVPLDDLLNEIRRRSITDYPKD